MRKKLCNYLQYGFALSLCLFFLLQWNTALLAQDKVDSNWKNQRITIKISNEPLGKVLTKVAEAAGAKIIYNGGTLVGINESTTININDKPFYEVVNQLIGDQNVKLRYETNKYLIIESAVNKTIEDNYCYVSGIVYGDDTKEPLIGATVYVTDGDNSNYVAGKTGCNTDIDGKFTLKVKRKQSISISYIGYESTSMQITKLENDLKIFLTPSSLGIEEVVVTGISKRNKNSFTGNYISVKGSEVRKINPINVLQGLQYFDPSFKVLQNNNRGSDPNAVPEFQMRGDQSFGADRELSSMDLMLDNVSSKPNTPLFVLDGFIVPMSRVLQLDPERIENIVILKDAAATSIYGSKASNGVISIETKIAPDGAITVSYNGGVTIQTPDLTDYNLMNAKEKLQMEWMAGVYDQNNAESMNTYNRYLRYVLAGVDTYWPSQPLRTAVLNRHSLSAAGGTEVFRYSLDLNIASNPGVMKESSNGRKGINFSMTYRKGKVRVGANINLAESNGNNSPYGSFSEYTKINPYYRLKNEYGEYEQILDNHTGAGSRIITNPLYNANVGIKDFSRSTTIATSLNLEYDILPNLRLSEQVSYTKGTARTEKFLPSEHTSFAQVSDLTSKGSYSKSNGEMGSWSSNLSLNYNLNLNKHLISFLANWTINEDKSDYINLYALGYPDKNMDDFIFGNKMPNGPSGSEALSRSMGLIGQFSYSYDNRYSFDFNVSSENSSRYSNNSLTPFWSTGFRWNAYREKWLQGKVSNLVFRTTYGVTGAQSFDPYQAIEFYTFSGTMRPYTSFGNLGAVLSGLNNPNLEWAKTDNFSAGIDLGVWNNRINLSLNYYNNITRQLLTDYDLAPSTGFSSQVINAGELQNIGFDASVNIIAFQDIKKELYWTIGFNANKNRNKIRKISDFLRKRNEAQLASKGAPLPIYQEGHSTTTLYTVRSLGIDPITGNEVYLTRDGKRTFTYNVVDKVPVGETAPKVSGTISTSLNWKDFQIMLGATYKYGGIIYNQTLVDKIENSNIAYNLDKRAMYNRWEKPGDIAKYKRIEAAGSETPASSRFIMDDNEIQLGTLNLGYRMSENKYSFLKKLNVNVLSLSFTTNNLFRLSTVKIERGFSYPFARTYTFTLSVIFK
jgi:TonB-linked outer membrane protein, SusC/RagA family/TonB-dependent outer membrane receptor, SusC/RagA subfamily, signature region